MALQWALAGLILCFGQAASIGDPATSEADHAAENSVLHKSAKDHCKTKPVKGIIFQQGSWDLTVESLNRFACDGGNAIEVEVWCSQKSIDDTTINCPKPPDRQLEEALKYASCIGMSTFISMVISTTNTEDTWCAHIGKNFNESQWDTWFGNWETHLKEWGKYSQSLGVQMMSVGAELNTTQPQQARWRKLVKGVRGTYKGKLTYGADKRSESSVEWWDALDVIGSHAYYRLANQTESPSLVDLRLGWRTNDMNNSGGHFDRLKDLSKKFGKPLVFLELGYRSMAEAHRCPGCWGLDGPVSYEHQADLFTALYETWCPQDWWDGVYFMGYPLDVKADTPPKGYQFLNTKAEDVMIDYYGGTGLGDACKQDIMYRPGCKAKVEGVQWQTANGVVMPNQTTSHERISPTALLSQPPADRRINPGPKLKGKAVSEATLYPFTSHDL